jgi:acetyl-CoA carboxylase alpha subunit
MDFVSEIFSVFIEIHGDRAFGNGFAVALGMARLEDEPGMDLFARKAQSRERAYKKQLWNASPEGYRKALRCMKPAEKFGRPIICIIDVPAAHPGTSSEERGQAEAIARNLPEVLRLRMPPSG